MSSEALNGDSTNSDEMNVGAVMERLGAYVDGELSPAEREAVEVLLQEDKSFLNAVRSFRWLDDVARQEDVAPVSGKEWARIWESIERMKEEPLSAPRAYISAEDTNHGQKLVLSGRFFYRLVAAAAILVLAFIGYQSMQGLDSEQRPDNGQNIVMPDDVQARSSDPEEEKLDNGESDEPGIAVISGEEPDEISEDGVIYRDF